MEAHIGLGTDTRPHAMSAVLRDERLAWLIGRGSERAFTSLYHRYHQQLYRYCHSMLREDADAQDALQATFAAAFAALRDGRRDAPLRPWLFRIAHNEAITILRRRRSHSELPDELPALANAIEEQAEHRERLRRLVADFRELPERQRAALLMRELSGLSHEEIAVALDTSVGTAKQTIYEARQALAEFEEGRMAACDEICRTISNGDRRALRARRIRAHLRECPACSAFAAAIPVRSADLRALAPALPPATTALLLSKALAVSVSGGSGSASGAVGAGAAGKATLALSGAKVATTVALATTASIGVATVLESHHASPGHTSGTRHLMRPAAERAGPLLATPRGAPQRAALSSSAAGARARATATATGTGTGTGTGTASVVRSGKGHAAVAPRPRTSPHRPNAVGATPTGGTTVPAPAPAGAVGTSNAGRSAHAHGGGAGKAAGAQPPPRASHGRGQQKSHGSSQGPQRSNPSPVPDIPNPAGVANGLVRGGPPVVHGSAPGNLHAHGHSD
jgi:RNA polymerase sigma factor (sigma-70 family)